MVSVYNLLKPEKHTFGFNVILTIFISVLIYVDVFYVFLIDATWE
jgi:hypothetical protein